MRGLARAGGRRDRWLAAIVAALIAPIGAQLVPASAAPALARHGTMTITVTGLPRHANGNLKLAGAGASHRITATTKLSLVPGTYTLTAQPVAALGGTYRPTIRLCSASAHCVSPSHGRVAVKANQRVSVRVEYALPKKAGAPLVGASPVVGPPQAPPGATLPSGKTETGGWAAAITSVAAGAPQEQAAGVISFSNPLPEGQEPKVVYLNEKQVAEPGSLKGCHGDALEPAAEAGYLCVFQGATATRGSLESEWKNAGFFALENFAGEKGRGGRDGELVVFRTSEFSESSTAMLAAPASLTAAGSWAVTAK